jgi:hypothetical protein
MKKEENSTGSPYARSEKCIQDFGWKIRKEITF